MAKFKDWDLLDELPQGWTIDKTVGSPLNGYEFCTNGKSVISGQKRALIKIDFNKNFDIKTSKQLPDILPIETIKAIDKNYIFPAKSVNNLARKRFQEQLLKEIMFDLMVCEIEGWDKLEYLKEIKKLINGFQTTVKLNKSNTIDSKMQPSFF